MRYDFSSPNGKVIKSYDGDAGWLIRNGQFEPMRPGEEIEMAEEPTHTGIYYKTTFSDFRSVDGLIFPFKMELIPNDRAPIPFSYDEIKVNVDFPEGFFTYTKNRK